MGRMPGGDSKLGSEAGRLQQLASENAELKAKMARMEEMLQRSMELGQRMYGMHDSRRVHIGPPAEPPQKPAPASAGPKRKQPKSSGSESSDPIRSGPGEMSASGVPLTQRGAAELRPTPQKTNKGGQPRKRSLGMWRDDKARTDGGPKQGATVGRCQRVR